MLTLKTREFVKLVDCLVPRANFAHFDNSSKNGKIHHIKKPKDPDLNLLVSKKPQAQTTRDQIGSVISVRYIFGKHTNTTVC